MKKSFKKKQKKQHNSAFFKILSPMKNESRVGERWVGKREECGRIRMTRFRGKEK